MAQSRTVPEATYPPGTYGPFELNQLPGNAEGFTITLTRVNWGGTTAETAVTILTEWRQSQSDPWQQIRLTTLPGGIIERHGVVETTSWIAQTWPTEFGVKKRGSDVRVTAIVAQTVTTAVTLEAI